ncbi:hypothetical protein GCM10008902_20320 [[Clostridium] innocuum]|jgi:hypothetical protein
MLLIRRYIHTLEDVQIKLDILYDSIQAFLTITGMNRKPIDMPTKEVDAMLRIYCNYIKKIQNDIYQLMKNGRSE